MLEAEAEERSGLVRERAELEGRIVSLQDLLDRSGDEDQVGLPTSLTFLYPSVKSGVLFTVEF